MFQWPLIVALVVSTFVGRVCPAPQKEGHNDGKGDIVPNGTTTSSILISNANKMVESSTTTTENEKDQQNKTESPVSLKNSTTVEPLPYLQKTIDDGKHNCNSSKETKDMTSCYVTPADDDEDIERNSAAIGESTNTTVAASNKTETSTESQVTKAIPLESKEKESGKKAIEAVVPLNHSEITDKISYDVVSTEAGHSVHTNDFDTVSKQGTNTSEASVSSIAPLLADNVAEDIVKPVKPTDKHMPSGLIALVTAISFAVAIAIVYIGMIIWRRYIEYRYGHRELLVNELEFDTNDLRHFEL